jgi:outer membrane protein, heavy metal efflux system
MGAAMNKRLAVILLTGSAALHLAAQQNSPQTQQPSMQPQQKPATSVLQDHQHDHQHVPGMTAAEPAPSAGDALRLEDLEQMGLSNNPTLKQAEAEIRATEGRKRQAGLYQNPTVGYQGEQIRGGSFGGGEQGAFVQQDIILGGKLAASKRIVEQERKQAEAEREEQKLRILNGIRVAFYRALAAQQTVALRTGLLKVAQDAVRTTGQLFNVGQADQPDVLQAEIEADQAQLALTAARQNQQRMWQLLASFVGNPALPFSTLAGNLEDVPNINTEEWLQKLLTDSPAVMIAQLGVARAEAQLYRAKRQPIPDLLLRGGVEQNLEIREGPRTPVGLQGFAEIGVQIPLFNRNQGNVQAAKADVDRAQLETKRVQLLLRERLASTAQSYLTAKATADLYRDRMIPRAEQAYKLYLEKYNSMTAAYPQVLIAQRTLFQLRTDYVTALESVWVNGIALRAFMLTDALEAPTPPTEIDRPVREINLPTPGELQR